MRVKATRVRVTGRRDGTSGLVVRVSVDGIGCCWISSLTRTAKLPLWLGRAKLFGISIIDSRAVVMSCP